MAKSASPETLSLDLADLSRPMITAPLLRSPDEVSQFAAYPPGYTAMWTIVTDLQEQFQSILTYVNPRLATQESDFASISAAVADKAARSEAVLEAMPFG